VLITVLCPGCRVVGETEATAVGARGAWKMETTGTNPVNDREPLGTDRVITFGMSGSSRFLIVSPVAIPSTSILPAGTEI
jgi:hypothetical protein